MSKEFDLRTEMEQRRAANDAFFQKQREEFLNDHRVQVRAVQAKKDEIDKKRQEALQRAATVRPTVTKVDPNDLEDNWDELNDPEDDGFKTVKKKKKNQKNRRRDDHNFRYYKTSVSQQAFWYSWMYDEIKLDFMINSMTLGPYDWLEKRFLKDGFSNWICNTEFSDCVGYVSTPNGLSVNGSLSPVTNATVDDHIKFMFDQKPIETVISILNASWSRNSTASTFAARCTSQFFVLKCADCKAAGKEVKPFIRMIESDSCDSHHCPSVPRGKRPLGMVSTAKTRYYKNAIFTGLNLGEYKAFGSRYFSLGSCLSSLVQVAVRSLYFWVPSGLQRYGDLDQTDPARIVYFNSTGENEGDLTRVSGTEAYLIQVPGFGIDAVTIMNHVFFGLVKAFYLMDVALVDRIMMETLSMAAISCISIFSSSSEKFWKPWIIKTIRGVCANSAALSHLAIPDLEGYAVIDTTINLANSTANGYSAHLSAVVAMMYVCSGMDSENVELCDFARFHCTRYCNFLLGDIKSMVIGSGGWFFKPVALKKAMKARKCVGLVYNEDSEGCEQVLIKRSAADPSRCLDDLDNFDGSSLRDHEALRRTINSIRNGGRTTTYVPTFVRFMDLGELNELVWKTEFPNDSTVKGWLRDPKMIRTDEGLTFNGHLFNKKAILPPVSMYRMQSEAPTLSGSIIDAVNDLNVAKVLNPDLGMTCVKYEMSKFAIANGRILAARVTALNSTLGSINMDKPRVLKSTPRRDLRKEDEIDRITTTSYRQEVCVILKYEGKYVTVRNKKDEQCFPYDRLFKGEKHERAVERIMLAQAGFYYKVTDHFEYVYVEIGYEVTAHVYTAEMDCGPANLNLISLVDKLDGLNLKSKKFFSEKYPEKSLLKNKYNKNNSSNKSNPKGKHKNNKNSKIPKGKPKNEKPPSKSEN
jgi:hypothetical protein